MKRKILSMSVTALLCIAAASTADVGVSDTAAHEDAHIQRSAESDVEVRDDAASATKVHIMNIKLGDKVLTATLADNSSAEALKTALSRGPVTVSMQDYGNMEKVGSLGFGLPRNDEQITTEPGDIILYQGSALVIYYAPNSWNFTRLGKINGVTGQELIEILGSGNITIILSLP